MPFNGFSDRGVIFVCYKIRFRSASGLDGTMDCLTTVVGTFFFGARELNPLIAGLVNSNLLAFVVVKLMVTVYVGVIFVLAEKILLGSANKVNRLFKMRTRS